MKHEITITQSHIDNSIRGSHDNHPALKALKVKFPNSFFHINDLIISENNTLTNKLTFYHVPKTLPAFNNNFITGNKVKPIAFTLEPIT